MKIVFVLECAGRMTNGTTATCIRFAEELTQRGHQVTIIGCEKDNVDPKIENYVTLDTFHFPVFNKLILKEGFTFVKVQPEKMVDVIKEADVVHIFIPFKLANTARLIAETYGVPVTSAFHLQPDSISSAIHLEWFHPLTNTLYYSFRKYIYDEVPLIHCPSEMISNLLKNKYNYKAETRVISNGLNVDFWHRVDSEKEEQFKDKFVVCMVGRLAKEKRQDVLIKAVKMSKHEKDIQLILCGQGPNKSNLEFLIKKTKLTNEPVFEFKSQEDLRYLLSSIDLYVHCSDAEIEGLSCVEAFSCGAVPVISDSKISATQNFALDENSLFKRANVQDLANKIDYWFEHPEERKALSQKYQELAKSYAIPLQVDKFEEFFEEAIKIKKEGRDPADLKMKLSDKRRRKNIFKRMLKKGAIDKMPEGI